MPINEQYKSFIIDKTVLEGGEFESGYYLRVVQSDNHSKVISNINIQTYFIDNTPSIDIKSFLADPENNITIILRHVAVGGLFTEEEISPNDLTYSKTTLTKSDAVECEGKYENRKIIILSYGINVGNQAYASTSISFVLDYKRPISIEPTYTDNNILYLNGEETWGYDASLIDFESVKVNYNDGTYYVDNQPNVRIQKYEVIHSSQDIFNSYGVIEQEEGKNLFMSYIAYNNELVNEAHSVELIYEYPLNILPDTIASLEFTEEPNSIVKAHRLNDYKEQFELTATDASGAEHVVMFDFLWGNDYLLQDLTSVQVVVGGETYEVPYTKSLTAAEIDTVYLLDQFKSTYELEESFDFSELRFEVAYKGTNYRTVSTFWGGNDGFTMSFEGLSNEEDFNGTSSLQDLGIDLNDSGKYMTISVSSSIAAQPFTVTNVINILQVTDIIRLEIKTPYTDYKVGDKFLKEEDTTQVTITYINENDETKQLTVKLNSGYSKIVVEPSKDEKFFKVEMNKKIRVTNTISSAFAEYLINVSAKVTSDDTAILNCYVEYYDEYEAPNGETYKPADEKGLLVIFTEEGEAIGWIEKINNKDINAKVVLFDNYLPEIDGSSNIEITYPYYGSNTPEDINNCHFGVLFGANNAKNRLFLSGNPNVGNADWHSSEPNYTDYEVVGIKSNGNFTYFSDASVMYYGETDNDIVGYEVVSNDKLLVLKNESDKEKTVYFRNPTVVKALNAAGQEELGISGESLYQEEFSLTKGNNSVAGVSPKTIVNFNGDTLFLDKNNQIVGLDVAGIIGDNQRYANTRSKYIDGLLQKVDLSDSILWTNNSYLFLTIKDIGLLATNFKTYNSDTKQYEWFLLTSENPTTFLEKDNVIYFANDKGRLFRYNKNYEDVKKIYSDLTLNYSSENGYLVVSDSVIKEILDTKYIDDYGNEKYWDFYFKPLTHENDDYKEKIFYHVAYMSNLSSDENAEIYIDNENNCMCVKESSLALTENTVYCLNSYFDGRQETSAIAYSGNPSIAFGRKIKVEQLVFDGDTTYFEKYKMYQLINEEWHEIDLGLLQAAELCCCVETNEVYVAGLYDRKSQTPYDEANYLVLSNSEGKIVKLVQYGDQEANQLFKAELRSYRNVEAFYITAPFVLGGLDLYKTVYSYTITNDTGIPSELEVAYASNKLPLVEMKKMSYISLTKENMGINLGNLNFAKIDLDKTVVPRTYTMHRVLPRQKFMCFAFRNYNNTNAVLSSMSVTYTVPFPSYGGD